jgi:hypothetical protein
VARDDRIRHQATVEPFNFRIDNPSNTAMIPNDQRSKSRRCGRRHRRSGSTALVDIPHRR